MSTKIVAEENLTEKQLNDINRHYTKCNTNDGTKYSFDEDLDFRNDNEINTFVLYENDEIVSTLSIFAPTKKEAEIIALTKPNKRRKGYFTILLENAVKEISKRGIETILYVCDRASQSGNETIQHLEAKYEFSEYLMHYTNKIEINAKFEQLKLVESKQEDIDKYIEINSTAFKMDKNESSNIVREFFASDRRELYGIKYENNIIGMIGIYKEQARFYIYGFCIDEKYRKRGIGTAVLKEIVEICIEKDRSRTIELEVQTKNENALNVYKNVGFNIETEFKYYRDSLYGR